MSLFVTYVFLLLFKVSNTTEVVSTLYKFTVSCLFLFLGSLFLLVLLYLLRNKEWPCCYRILALILIFQLYFFCDWNAVGVFSFEFDKIYWQISSQLKVKSHCMFTMILILIFQCNPFQKISLTINEFIRIYNNSNQ